jgi:hypothetical protein
MSEDIYQNCVTQAVGLWAYTFNNTTKLLYGATWGASEKADENDISESEVAVFFDSITLLETTLYSQISRMAPDDFEDIKTGLEAMRNNWQLSMGGKDFSLFLIISLCASSMNVIDRIMAVIQTWDVEEPDES